MYPHQDKKERTHSWHHSPLGFLFLYSEKNCFSHDWWTSLIWVPRPRCVILWWYYVTISVSIRCAGMWDNYQGLAAQPPVHGISQHFSLRAVVHLRLCEYFLPQSCESCGKVMVVGISWLPWAVVWTVWVVPVGDADWALACRVPILSWWNMQSFPARRGIQYLSIFKAWVQGLVGWCHEMWCVLRNLTHASIFTTDLWD